MSQFLDSIPSDIKEDFDSLLESKGMEVLRRVLTANIRAVEIALSTGRGDTMDEVSRLRGSREAYVTTLNFIKKEQRRAAKGQTPAETEE